MFGYNTRYLFNATYNVPLILICIRGNQYATVI